MKNDYLDVRVLDCGEGLLDLPITDDQPASVRFAALCTPARVERRNAHGEISHGDAVREAERAYRLWAVSAVIVAVEVVPSSEARGGEF